MLIGAIVAILPHLGFPDSIDSALYFLLGCAVIAVGIVVRRRFSHSPIFERRSMHIRKDTFVEATPVTHESAEDHVDHSHT